MLANYVPRAYLQFFYTCSFVTSLRRCRQWMYVQIASGARPAAQLRWRSEAWAAIRANTASAFPTASSMPTPTTWRWLCLLAIASFLFLFHRTAHAPDGWPASREFCWPRSMRFRTGSRGSVIAASAMLILIFWLSRNRWKVAALGFAAPWESLLAASSAANPPARCIACPFC